MSQQYADGTSSLSPRVGRTAGSIVEDLIATNVIPQDHNGAIYVIDTTTSYFAKAIVMMSKIGDNLYLVPASEGLYVKGLNDARTVVGGFLFRTNYFCYSDTSRLDATRSANMCRLSMKSAVATFHSIGERKPCSSLVLFLDPKGDTMKVIFYVNCDVVKTHELRLRETTTTFKCLFDDSKKDQMPNMIRCPPGHFTKVLGSHISFYDTIIDCRADRKVFFRRFLPPEDGERPQIMKREGYISASDMLKYKMTLKSEVSISTKEFLAMVLYADSVGITLIDVLIAEPGKPLIISMTETPDEFSAEFHISTMEGEMNEPPSSLNSSNCSFTASQVNMNTSRTPFAPPPKKRKSPVVTVVPISRIVKEEQSTSQNQALHDSFDDEDDDDEFAATIAEMSERSRLTEAQNASARGSQQVSQQSSVYEPIEDSILKMEPTSRTNLRLRFSSTPSTPEDAVNSRGESVKNSVSGADTDVFSVDPNRTRRSTRILASGESRDAEMIPAANGAVEEEIFPISQPQYPADLYASQRAVVQPVEERDRTPPPNEEEMFPASPEAKLSINKSRPQSLQVIERDRTPPAEDLEDEEMFPASPEETRPPPIHRTSWNETMGRNETPPPQINQDEAMFPASPEVPKTTNFSSRSVPQANQEPDHEELFPHEGYEEEEEEELFPASPPAQGTYTIRNGNSRGLPGHNEAPSAAEDDEDDLFSASPPAPATYTIHNIASQSSNGRDETPPPEEDEGDVFPESPQKGGTYVVNSNVPESNGHADDNEEGHVFPRSPSPPMFRRRHLLNSSQATFYGTQTEGQILACRTPRVSQKPK